tara:strand:+ start:1915 stop:2397 length:483 start_codon:yes stop_codon:yes gene_type:complete
MAEPTFKIQGAKEIANMFGDLPKQIKQYNLWKALWRKIAKPALNEAKNRVPEKTGQLKNSIGFFTTRKTKNFMGLYLGPRVKRTFRSKEKSGFYGAFIEYGDEVMFFGKGQGKAQKYMKPAWDGNKMGMTQNAFKEATKIAASAIKRHEKRLQKYGTLGY